MNAFRGLGRHFLTKREGICILETFSCDSKVIIIPIYLWCTFLDCVLTCCADILVPFWGTLGFILVQRRPHRVHQSRASIFSKTRLRPTSSSRPIGFCAYLGYETGLPEPVNCLEALGCCAGLPESVCLSEGSNHPINSTNSQERNVDEFAVASSRMIPER